MSFDEDLARLIRESAELAPDPPGETLALAGARRGRRRGLRRRAALTGAAALAVAALTATTLPGTSGPATGGPHGRITGTYMLTTLASLLPPGQISDQLGYGIGESDRPEIGPLAVLQYDDGHGSTRVVLATDRIDLPITDATPDTQCRDPFTERVESCRRTVGPDGSVLVVRKDVPMDSDLIRTWTAVYTGADGRQVRINEANLGAGNGHSASRPDLPLTLEQLAAVVTSDAWNPVFEDFTRGATHPPTDPAAAAPLLPVSTPSVLSPAVAAKWLGTVRSLLPTGAVPGDPGEQLTGGAVHLPVTFDGRTSAVQVRVQPGWAAANRDRAASFGHDAEPGSLVRGGDGTVSAVQVVHDKHDQTRVLYWTADALRADGTLISVTEVNGTTWYDPQPGTPALSTDQLRDMAAADAWQGAAG